METFFVTKVSAGLSWICVGERPILSVNGMGGNPWFPRDHAPAV